MAVREGWHKHVFFGIHYDLHANARDTELGADFTHEHLRGILERIRPDWVQCDCKGHPGYTSWPTETGTASPGVVGDQLRVYRDVTAELGIPLGMHYSGVIDELAIQQRPDWAAVDAEGKPDSRSTCLLSPYADELMIPQMLELVDKYDVDGFWVDGENWGAVPCWCGRCRAEFARRNGGAEPPRQVGDPLWHEWIAFHRGLFIEYVTKYADAVHARKPECQICSNWMYTLRQPEPVAAPIDYISGDYTPNWGADRAAVEGRFIASRGITWDLMAWGFTRSAAEVKSGQFLMKPAVHLCQEVAGVVALGGAVMVYMKPERTGRLVKWHHDILEDVARFCRERQEACFGTETASEAAILHLPETLYQRNQPLYKLAGAQNPVEGALHALLETDRSADILCRDAALEYLGQYKLVVLPQQVCVGEDMMDALRRYAEEGGNVLLTGAHLAGSFGDFVGADPEGALVESRISMAAGGRACALASGWQPVKPRPGTAAVRRRMPRNDPECGETGEVLATLRPMGKGKVLAVHGPLFESYFLDHSPWIRALVAELVDMLGIEWTVESDGPHWLEHIVRRKGDRLVVNLHNRGAAATLSPHRPLVESVAPVGPVTLKIRRAERPRSVRAVPAQATDWDWKGATLTVRLDGVAVHVAVLVE